MTRWTGFLPALVAAAAGTIAAGATGCGTSAASTGGGGAATTSTTSTGGTGGAGGSAPVCKAGVAQCVAITDCPPTQNECVDTTCVKGCCGTMDVAAMTPTATQTPGDCEEVVCDGMGGTQMMEDDTDVPDDMNPCIADSCSMGSPVRTPVAGACTANGGAVCGDPAGMNAGNCVACNVTADCTAGVCTMSGGCEPSTCVDGMKDGMETDVDCGGGACPACASGKMCVANTDCAGGTCLVNDVCM
jgi:hypothetical protein